jgi:radical SAM superfamily enzyme YgiQ (UPF0313 family)
MPSKVLLISMNRCTHPDPVFPLGLAQLNAALRGAGHDTRWLDLLADPESLEDVLEEYKPDFTGISLRNIDDVLIRIKETYFGGLNELCGTIRLHSRCPVILGGSGFSIFPQELFEASAANFGICGAGETALVALINALEHGQPYDSIPGLVFRDSGHVVSVAQAAFTPAGRVEDADLPRRLLDFYLRSGGMLNVQTQRGCAFRCCYCTYPVIEGWAHIRRPADEIAAEFERLQRLGAKYVFIVDSVFNSSPRHVAETCEALLRLGIKIPWGCFLRPRGLTPELMKLMSRAGLTHIEFGTDSFCDEVLAAYHKNFTFEDVLRSSELAHQEKIDYCHYLICGGPGETPQTIQEGFERSQRLSGAVILVVVGMRIYPGTHLFEQACREGVISRETDLLEPQYYLSPALTMESAFDQLREFARQTANWIVGDPDPEYSQFVEKLRQRGVEGPLWSYLPALQRVWPGLGERTAAHRTNR